MKKTYQKNYGKRLMAVCVPKMHHFPFTVLNFRRTLRKFGRSTQLGNTVSFSAHGGGSFKVTCPVDITKSNQFKMYWFHQPEFEPFEMVEYTFHADSSKQVLEKLLKHDLI
ncbi:hypothetical protein [Flavobacterium sp. 3HN19-14]|uniref:hypothetical protein n=1 Tax=Flavobacterium sp. 3HN19-14 TaxID=3448133 RepID=UPI003EE14A6F